MAGLILVTINGNCKRKIQTYVRIKIKSSSDKSKNECVASSHDRMKYNNFTGLPAAAHVAE